MTATKEVAEKRKTLTELLNDDATQKRFESMLGKDARSFAQNILTVYNGSKGLQDCEPESIIAACSISASIGLSILPSLGHSCVVPYKDGERKVAQWQLMYKGGIQLAQRSGRYAKINLARVYEGQLVSHDEFKGEVILDASKKISNRVMGYYFFFRLLDGYVHESYWSSKKCIEHGLRFSKSMQAGNGKWTEDPEFQKVGSVKEWLAGKTHFLTEGNGADAMSAKTIVKIELLKWGPLETRIKETMALDQAVIGSDGSPRFVDTTAEPAGEAKTYSAPPPADAGAEEKIAWIKQHAEKQGVTHAQFDSWRKSLGHASVEDDLARAKALWGLVAKKEIKASEAFKVVAPSEEKEFSFLVSGTATTDFNGNPDFFVIRDSSDPAIKHFTDQETIYKSAKAAQKAEKTLSIKFIEKKSGDHFVRWITALV